MNKIEKQTIKADVVVDAVELEKVKNIQYIRVRQYPKEGGACGFSQDYSRSAPSEDFDVVYDTTSWLAFCPVYGVFRSCDRCDEWAGSGELVEPGKCIARILTITEEMLELILDDIKTGEDAYSYVAEFKTFE